MRKINIFMAAALLLLTSCQTFNNTFNSANSSNQEETNRRAFSKFKDVPVPQGSKMNYDETKVFSEEKEWIGILAFSSPYSKDGVFDFYTDQLPNFGWTKISSVRNENPVLTYKKESRIATIQLKESTFSNLKTTITMTPNTNQVSKTRTVYTLENNQNAPSQPIVDPLQNNKVIVGDLGLGSASNRYYSSDSKGVGKPVNQ